MNNLIKSKKPSENLKYNLISIIYSYAYTIKLYNGELFSSDSLLNSSFSIYYLSDVISKQENYYDLRTCINNSLINSQKPFLFDNLKFSVYTIEDAFQITSNKYYIVNVLNDLTLLYKNSSKLLIKEKNIEFSKIFKNIEKKLFFYNIWINELNDLNIFKDLKIDQEFEFHLNNIKN
jgi:hypothetical protein